MAIPGLLKRLSSYVKPSKCTIDNFVFQLHYKMTVAVLLAFSLIVMSKQHIGDPIKCIGNEKAVPTKLLENFCWIETTYSLVSEWNKTVGSEVPYPGISNSRQEDEKRVYHTYYQWVYFVLYFQALMFLVPRWIWKMIEDKRTSNLLMGLDSPIVKEKDKTKKFRSIINYFLSHRGLHGRLCLWYLSCEILNVINVFGQIHMMHEFLGGKFWSFGFDVLSQEFNSTSDPIAFDALIELFPRMTKCTFHSYGPSGDVQRTDAFCLLSINNVNEKIYIVLWFWFFILGFLSIMAVIYRIMSILSRRARVSITHSRCRMLKRDVIIPVVEGLSIGDWFLLDRLSKNMAGFNFKQLLESLQPELKRECHKSRENDSCSSSLCRNHNTNCNCHQFNLKILQNVQD